MSENSAERWDATYNREGPPPWDIGRPQPDVVDIIERGGLTGDLLDSGCGSGEQALLAAQRGSNVTGVDISATAISRAREKAAERGVTARFEVVDMLGPTPFADRSFDRILDSGVFHSFEGEEQRRYVANLTELAREGAVAYVMVFSNEEPGDWGPRRITQDEIRSAFATGWVVDDISPATYHLNEIENTTRAKAWLATLQRV